MNESVFDDIFRLRKWGGNSVSGPGSTLQATKQIRNELREFFKDFSIRSLADTPCGDGIWISELVDKLDLYLGGDIVSDIVHQNIENRFSDNQFFRIFDISCDILPTVDAILCRDCLVHFPFDLIFSTLRNFKKSGSRYLITTSFPAHFSNIDIKIGGWRPLNLQIKPFNLPTPLRIMRERVDNPSDIYSDKSLLVWDLNSIFV